MAGDARLGRGGAPAPTGHRGAPAVFITSEVRQWMTLLAFGHQVVCTAYNYECAKINGKVNAVSLVFPLADECEFRLLLKLAPRSPCCANEKWRRAEVNPPQRATR